MSKVPDLKHGHGDQYKGWVYKWTNYIKGYQKRWFVLQNGLLSYYRYEYDCSHIVHTRISTYCRSDSPSCVKPNVYAALLFRFPDERGP